MKVLTCFGMIWNYDNFSRQNTKFGKICAFSKKLISPNLIIKKITFWGDYKLNVYKILKHFIWEFLFTKTCWLGEKNPKKYNNFKCKLNTLAWNTLFGPIYMFWIYFFNTFFTTCKFICVTFTLQQFYTMLNNHTWLYMSRTRRSTRTKAKKKV